MFENIVIICTGNICRSPYAEYALKSRAPQAIVSSAGIAALEDKPADPIAQAVAKNRGLDLSKHRGRKVTAGMIGQADIVLVMSDSHLVRLHRKFPETRGKAFKLAKFNGDKDISDPYLKSQQFFELVFDEIDSALASWLERIN